MSLFKTALMVCLCLVSTLAANPLHRIGDLDSVPSKGFQTQHGSRSQFTQSNANGKLCSSSDKSCKLHRRPQDAHIWRAHPLEPISPTHHTVPMLWDLYHALITQVNERGPLNILSPRFWATQLGWLGPYESIHQNSDKNRAIGGNPTAAASQLSLPQHRLTEPRAVKEARSTELKKRNGFQLIAFRLYTTILPLPSAAVAVKAFFDAVALEASGAWLSRPASALFTVTKGPFQLTVSSLGSPLPWSVLALTAQRFSLLADHQWTCTFDAYYSVLGSDVTIAISLRLLPLTTAPGPLRISLHNDPLTLRKRLPDHASPGLYVATFTRTAALVPPGIAASLLEDFYTIIALRIETGQMENRAPSKTVICSLWDFELSFSSDAIVVPLSFIQAFAIDMAEWSSRQWTGFYEATVRGEGPLSGLVILVRMKLKGQGKAVGIAPFHT